ncbi:MAG: hypothetical protein Unbinned200contig1000_17 [Prokaryotic dsDNA virus sp.]|mgnify:CR=1 FL=1|jgi:hypothetical protein|nr:hypothetical protein [Flavobacteriaceae bacterium]QDP65277.1 MAG: hypothetical protein Unbinned200contig1000_17 [Prokaryotic dsDNA virus sp.]|tara:strand:+ start:23914 stop:25476 length:1563 start_codon:yes stop_codon:yes gene_type:complete
MAQVPKIDSNITGLAYAEEASLGLLPGEGGLGGTPVWKRLNPNSYSDFGGEIITVAPNPINPSRQRRKGVTTDLNASGGFNHSLTYENLSDMMQGVFFADIRAQAEETVTAVDTDTVNPDEYEIADTSGYLVGNLVMGKNFVNAANNAVNKVTAIVANISVEVADGQLVAEASPPANAVLKVVGYEFDDADAVIDVSGNLPRLTSNGGLADFTTLGLVPGQWVYIGGDVTANSFSDAANNGFKRIRAVATDGITFDKSDSAMVGDAGIAGKTIRLFYGDVLRNETGSLIRRRTYNIERTLGAPDDASPSQIQSEVLKGAVPNEVSFNIPQADLASVDFTFVATDNEQRDSATGPKQTNVQDPVAATEYNTSSDIGRIRLAAVSDVDEAPTALFAYVTEATININNNVTPNKAVGVLGAFDVTAGTFEVSGELTAYFSNVAATQAVRNNSDVTLDISFVKDNTAMIIDLPLISLGDGRLNVEVDQPITLPLSTDAASGQDVSTDLDHTALITYFDYVPSAA